MAYTLTNRPQTSCLGVRGGYNFENHRPARPIENLSKILIFRINPVSAQWLGQNAALQFSDVPSGDFTCLNHFV
jgi:hypothetical protein